MTFSSKRIALAIAILVAFATVNIDVNFAEPGSAVPGESVAMTQPQTLGILTTQGNKEIIVNGTNLISGATIVSGANLETPTGVSATISLGSRGSLEIEPNTKLTVEFDPGGVKVMLTEGCASLGTKKGTTGEITTPKGPAGKTDSAQDGKLEICPRPGAARIVAAGATSGGLCGLATAAAVAIIGGRETAVSVPVAPRGVLY